MNISPTSTYTAIDIGEWPNFMRYAHTIATIRMRHLPKPETWKETFDMVDEFSTIPEGTHWGLNEGVAGLWIHDLDLFLEKNKAEIQACIKEGERVLSMDEIRKCTIKEEENNE